MIGQKKAVYLSDSTATKFVNELGIDRESSAAALTALDATQSWEINGGGANVVLAAVKAESAEIPVGIHCILELYDCPTDLLNNVVFIRQALQEAALRAQSTLIDQVAYQFNPQGVTALALLAESHISIHTWPEHGYVAADVFTCGQHVEPEKACQYLVQTFRANKHSFFKLRRGRLAPDILRKM